MAQLLRVLRLRRRMADEVTPMSGSQALSVKTPATENHSRPRAPREAELVDAPVPSPVHELQIQLERFQDQASDDQVDDPSVDLKAPGWVRIAAPIAVSITLWSAIFWLVGLSR